MGLDMYLNKKTYIGAKFEHRNVKAKIEIEIEGKKIPIDVSKLAEITEEVGYWRKANQIHAWFVKNVQEDVDDCQEYYVSKSDLKELVRVCKQVKDDPKLAEKLLPPQEGFFFGGTAVDEYYMGDVEETIVILEEALKGEGRYYYTSSW